MRSLTLRARSTRSSSSSPRKALGAAQQGRSLPSGVSAYRGSCGPTGGSSPTYQPHRLLLSHNGLSAPPCLRAFTQAVSFLPATLFHMTDTCHLVFILQVSSRVLFGSVSPTLKSNLRS